MRTARMLLAVVGCVFAIAVPLSAQADPGAPTPPSQGESPVEAEPRPLLRNVSLDLHDVPLGDALKEINRQARLGLAYSPQVVPVDRPVTIQADSIPAGEALHRVLDGTGVQVQLAATGTVFLVKSEPSPEPAVHRRAGFLAGQVLDSATHEPLSGAQVLLRNTSLSAAPPLSAVTNDAGVYVIRDVPAGRYTVTARRIGYTPSTRTVTVPDGLGESQELRVDFALRMGMTRLEEVVSTATGGKRRLEIANDITVIYVDSVLATAPITSVTDLLATRVPGLMVQPTSGAPGDPARIRIRGVSSVYGNNDPIVIVDGVRVYSAQSDARSANLAGSYGAEFNDGRVAAPSPLDQIDPQSIERIEVLKGPSAATLYGADAANGVIVITSKRGRPGPARWRATVSRGRSAMPGRYPDAYFAWGHFTQQPSTPILCPLAGQVSGEACLADSLARFQLLNTPAYTVLGHGGSSRLSLGVDGGAGDLAYSFTGTYEDDTGILQLPAYEAARFQTAHGYAPPDWMQRPQSLGRWSATGRVNARLGAKAEASVTTTLTRGTQQRSSLETQLGTLMSVYVDPTSQAIYQATNTVLTPAVSLVPDFYRRATDIATNFTNAAHLGWTPRTWLATSADAGLNVISRRDEVLLPRDMLDTLGSLSTARGSSVVGTVNLSATATTSLPLGFRFQFATGANYTKTSIADLQVGVSGFTEGTTGVGGAGHWTPPNELVTDVTNLGWYVEPALAHKRFFVNAGLRFDGGSTYGEHASLPTFPKLGGTWLISDEPFFPNALRDVFNTLKIRAAYGHAGVQPGITDRLRLYQGGRPWVDGGQAEVNLLQTLGNTQIRPERSTELEWGFDADLLNDRASVGFSAYRKIRKDALLQVPVAPSVYGDQVTIWRNVGVVRNAGLEATIAAQLVRSAPVTWSATVGVSRNRNVVVSLAPGVEPFYIDATNRVARGYPLFGRWVKPILGYSDLDHDGVIQPGEVQVGDSAVFMGESVPNYQTSLHTTVSLLRGTITIDAGFDYQDGLTQVNTIAKRNQVLSRGANDPTAPLSEQAAVAVMSQTDYGLMQTVNVLRFNSLSVAFNAPTAVARRVGASALSVALQGTNLGLITNYRGKDPSVNAYASGNSIADTGQLPQPRMWVVTVTAHY